MVARKHSGRTSIESDEVPYRMPFSVLDQLSLIFQGRHVLDIGCSKGDLLIYLKEKFGCHVLGIERFENRAAISRSKGIEVIIGDASELVIPDAEVYVLWIEKPDIERIVARRIESGTLIIFYNTRSDVYCGELDCSCRHKKIGEKYRQLIDGLNQEGVDYSIRELLRPSQNRDREALTGFPSHTTRHTGPYHGGSVGLNGSTR